MKKKILKAALGAGLVAALGVGAYASHGQHKLRKANKIGRRLANASAINDAGHGAVNAQMIGDKYPETGWNAVNGAVSGGLHGLIQHHVGRKLVDKVVDRNGHWWNAGKRAKMKNRINTAFAIYNAARNAHHTVTTANALRNS